MAAQVCALQHLAADHSGSLPCQIGHAVYICGKGQSIELVHISSGLEAEVFDGLEGAGIVQKAQSENTALLDQVAGVIGVQHRDRHSGG